MLILPEVIDAVVADRYKALEVRGHEAGFLAGLVLETGLRA